MNILPNLVDALIREVTTELADLDRSDEVLLTESLEQMQTSLSPLADELVNRLAERAKDTIGISGVATGVMRKTSDEVRNSGVVVSDWWWSLFGTESGSERVERPFLSEQTRSDVASAVQDETLKFWQDHRATIIDALVEVVGEQRPQFEQAFRERWAGRLYERAVMPAWQAGEDEVLFAVQNYAHDFAVRRLLTAEGGPRLLFAHALRSSLDISDSPLLVYYPGTGANSEATVYEPLLRFEE